jgi:hypothetical protein
MHLTSSSDVGHATVRSITRRQTMPAGRPAELTVKIKALEDAETKEIRWFKTHNNQQYLVIVRRIDETDRRPFETPFENEKRKREAKSS